MTTAFGLLVRQHAPPEPHLRSPAEAGKRRSSDCSSGLKLGNMLLDNHRSLGNSEVAIVNFTHAGVSPGI